MLYKAEATIFSELKLKAKNIIRGYNVDIFNIKMVAAYSNVGFKCLIYPQSNFLYKAIFPLSFTPLSLFWSYFKLLWAYVYFQLHKLPSFKWLLKINLCKQINCWFVIPYSFVPHINADIYLHVCDMNTYQSYNSSLQKQTSSFSTL
jgi:hypothetical protein